MMTSTSPSPFAGHGGLLIPLDMFRVSLIASVIGETLVARARNASDAKLRLTRHPESQIVLGRIEGAVVGDDPVAFWKENAEIALAVSQVVPREVFLYYTRPGPGADRLEAFLVARQGQVLAGDEATPETLGPGAGPEAWPLSRLCEQMGITLDELAKGFPGGPTVTASLISPQVDDRDALMILAGQLPEGGDAAAPGQAQAAAPEAEPTISDQARRAAAAAEEEAARQRRAAELAGALPTFEDDLGIVVAPQAELAEADLLRPYLAARIEGELPDGLPRDRTRELQGKRLDLAVPVEFLSEVFTARNRPLSRPEFDASATPCTVAGHAARCMKVLAPRLGHGTLLDLDGARVFVSRTPDLPLPEPLVARLAGKA